MHGLDSCPEDQLNDPIEYPNSFMFDEKGDATWYKVEGGIPHKHENLTDPSHGKMEILPKIKDFDVRTWLEETRRLTAETRGSYRLVVVENPSGPPTKFPLTKDRLSLMLRTWEFPPWHELLHAIHYGGSAVFEASSSGRKNFLIGGGMFTHSIGAVFSYDEGLHITTGCIILGKHIKWAQRSRDEFLRSSLNIDFNPLSIPVLIASIIMDTLNTNRDEFLKKIKEMEDYVEETVQQRNRESWSQQLDPRDHRSIFHELSKRKWDLGRIQMLIGRNNLILKFAAETTKNWQGPQIPANLQGRIQLMQNSLEHMSVEIQVLSGRLQSQVMIVTNFIAQQDIILSSQIAKDSKVIAVGSKEIAAATRRDGVAMKIIAGGGAVFLPATVISAFLALLQLQWNVGKMIVVYFAITIPFTVIVLGVVYAFWRLLDEKLEKEVYKMKGKRDAGYNDSKSTPPELIF